MSPTLTESRRGLTLRVLLQLPAVDHLSRLPNELPARIFDLVWRDWRPQKVGVLNRALLPFVYANSYYWIEVKSYERLDQLCQSIAADASLGRMVFKLAIWIDGDKDDRGWTRGLKADPGTPTSAALVQLLEAMPNLVELQLVGCVEAARTVLEHELEDGSLPSLARLMLEEAFPSDPFDPRLYSNLRHYPKLCQLVIQLSPFLPPLPAAQPLQADPPSLDFITSLELYADLSSPSIPVLLASFPSLLNLIFVNTSPTPNYPPLLLAVTPSLQQLTLCSLPSNGVPDEWTLHPPVDHFLPRFTRLTHLSIHGPCATLDLIDFLPPSLKELRLGYDVRLFEGELWRLIAEPRRLSALTYFDMSFFFGTFGTTIEESGGKVYENPETGALEPYPDWELPDWSEDFTRAGVEEFMKKAWGLGLMASGTMGLATDVQEQFEHEVALVTKEEERRARLVIGVAEESV